MTWRSVVLFIPSMKPKIDPQKQNAELLPAVFLTAAELAARWKVTEMTLRRWRRLGRLETTHLGRGVRFALSTIERIEKEAKA